MYEKKKILPNAAEKQKLIDYVRKRVGTNNSDGKNIDECLEQCLSAIEQSTVPPPLLTVDNKMSKRLMNIISVYVASQSSDNSFLKALYDKMGSSLDLDSLNAETNEHEVVNVTVTKTIRQIFVDKSSSLLPNNSNIISGNVTQQPNNEQPIPADLPDDIRLKAEQVMNSLNDMINIKHN